MTEHVASQRPGRSFGCIAAPWSRGAGPQAIFDRLRWLGTTTLSIGPIPVLFNATIPGDASLAGTTFALQLLDLLPGNATGTPCGRPKLSQKSRVSDTRVITIQ